MKLCARMLAITGCLAAFVAARTAEAADFYAGAGVGAVHASGPCFSSKRAELSALAGYRFTQHLALEAGYADTALRGSTDCVAGATLDMGRLTVRANLALDITSRLSLVAHAGATRSVADVHLPDRPYRCSPNLACPAVVLPATSYEVTDTAFTWGGGVQWLFGDRLRLRAEYGQVDTDLVDLSTATLSLSWAF